MILGGAVGYALGVGFFDWLGLGTGVIVVLIGLIVGAIFAIGTFMLGVPILLVMVFSAFSGAAAVVNGVLIVFGTIKLDDAQPGHLRLPCSPRGSSALWSSWCSERPRSSTRCATSARRSPRSIGAPTATRLDMQPRSLVAAIDQGTTSSRCILFDRAGRPVAGHQLEHRQITPRPGWVEHDADEILERVQTCVRVALREAGVDAAAARGGRHQQPARDDRGLVAPDRAAGRTRDRLAGHADRGRRRAAGRRRTRAGRTASGP